MVFTHTETIQYCQWPFHGYPSRWSKEWFFLFFFLLNSIQLITCSMLTEPQCIFANLFYWIQFEYNQLQCLFDGFLFSLKKQITIFIRSIHAQKKKFNSSRTDVRIRISNDKIYTLSEFNAIHLWKYPIVIIITARAKANISVTMIP